MAFSRGPVIVRDGLVLYYDVANIKSFRGEPATNVLTSVSYTFGTVNDTYFKTNYGTETVYIPALGTKTAHYCNIYNDFNGGSGICCPAPFFFGDFTVSPSTTYTYQIIFRTSTGYNHPNYMYHYQYNGGTYVTEFGLFSTSRVEELGDGWKHGWGTFTTNASTNRLITYLFHYEYGVWNKIQVAGIMLSQRSTPLDPKFIIPPTASRGTTVASGGGVIDISNNGTGAEIIGPVYSSSNKGGLVFDGTDDVVSTSLTGSINDMTVECWFRGTKSTRNHLWDFGSSGSSTNLSCNFNDSGYDLWMYWEGGGTNRVRYNIEGSFTDGNIKYLVFTHTGSTNKVYLDGAELTITESGGTQTFSNVNGTNNFRIGGDVPFGGNVYLTRVYNRALTSNEILQNYNATKGRFI